MKRLFALSLLIFGLSHTVSAEEYSAGIDYQLIEPPVVLENEGKVRVVEVFWYGCPHCDNFEPYIQHWLKAKADYVAFERQPGVFNNPVWQLHAAAFYTAEQLGIGEVVHGPIFDAIHRQGNPLNNASSLQAFFAQYGIEAEQFTATLDSDAVRTRVLRAHQLSQQYGINGVPAMIVNGKYLVDGGLAGSYPRLLAIVDHLAAMEANGVPANSGE